ncbi:hypothetical protein MNBD_DELTA01-1760 [hydrothermal vent metagenome]|uniref:Methyltransferase domain-containing protein n=1 Tax=hydrothermal vent metagenome TaxID=652676 RepID=A0A3B0QRT7_9ZZZZ
MSDFKETKWAAKDYAEGYLEKVNAIIPLRPRLLELLSSFCCHFLGDGQPRRIVELGCGDGAFTEELLKTGIPTQATLIDGSEEMLSQAKVRLGAYKDIRFVHSSFQELTGNNALPENTDLIFSVLAIHHLSAKEKRELFNLVYSQLAPGGFFINIDDCIPQSTLIEDWYLDRWKKEMTKKAAELGVDIDPQSYNDKHKDPEHHKTLETLADLCKALEVTGFTSVECFFKDGIFTAYGGQKPNNSPTETL